MDEGSLASALAPVAAPATATYAFLIDAASERDILLRVLNVFALRQVAPESIQMNRDPDGAAIRIEAAGLTHPQAEYLVDKLRNLQAMRAVGLGWRMP